MSTNNEVGSQCCTGESLSALGTTLPLPLGGERFELTPELGPRSGMMTST
jgi:hypothetical protein